MTNLISLVNKRIMVTGASSGIGKATAILCSQLGADMVLVARNIEKLNETKSQLAYGKHVVIPYDLYDVENIAQLFDECIKNGSRLGGLVHSAGVCPNIPLPTLNYKKMLDIMNLNYFSFMELTKQYSKKKYSNGGSIISISSISSFVGTRGASVYCGSKGALDSSVKALALELLQKNIRINTVVPSYIDTDMYTTLEGIAGDEFKNNILKRQPLGLGKSEDVANAVTFLLSDASRFITGTSLKVDGGYTAQ
jgi:NAD(P)-dependent dehydrogenase (short-subunit alcohol dehydrogenase family)